MIPEFNDFNPEQLQRTISLEVNLPHTLDLYLDTVTRTEFGTDTEPTLVLVYAKLGRVEIVLCVNVNTPVVFIQRLNSLAYLQLSPSELANLGQGLVNHRHTISTEVGNSYQAKLTASGASQEGGAE